MQISSLAPSCLALAVSTMQAHPQTPPFPTEGRGNPRVEQLGTSVDQMIYEFMETERIPGMTLAIVQAPYITRVVSYGLSDLTEKRLASTKTVWAVGPISQAYAAVAVMQLVEAGKLDLSDPVSKFLPDVPTAWRAVTLLQLLQHASGIADYRTQPGYNVGKDLSTNQLVALLKDVPLAFAAGTDVAQSATNFLLAATIVEQASGVSYRDFVTKHQIEPMGLQHTMFASDLSTLKEEKVAANGNQHREFLQANAFVDPTEHATGYTSALLPANPAASKGFSDIWASAEDISRWDIGLAGSILIAKPEHRALLYGPTTLANGKQFPAMAGWQFFHHKGLMMIKGTTRGFSSLLARFTDKSELVCVTLLANKEGVELSNLGRRIAGAFGKSLGSDVDDRRLYVQESVFSVEETMARVEADLQRRGIPVFAKFDHARNAKEAQLELRPTQVIVFGSPKVGTALMQAEQSIAIELPLRISVWQDAAGSVWAAAPRVGVMVKEYGLKDESAAPAMESLLRELLSRACVVY